MSTIFLLAKYFLPVLKKCQHIGIFLGNILCQLVKYYFGQDIDNVGLQLRLVLNYMLYYPNMPTREKDVGADMYSSKVVKYRGFKLLVQIINKRFFFLACFFFLLRSNVNLNLCFCVRIKTEKGLV